MVFYFFSGVGVKVACINVGFMGRVVGVGSKSIEEFGKVPLVGEDIHTSQMDYIIVERR